MLYRTRRNSMTNQQLDMLSGFLFGLGFGMITGYYFIP